MTQGMGLMLIFAAQLLSVLRQQLLESQLVITLSRAQPSAH